MRMEDAIRVSEVESRIDGPSGLDRWLRRPGAKVDYYSKHLTVIEKEKKYIVAYGPDDFVIVHADTLRPVSRNPHLQIEDFHKVLGREDWEPL